MFLLSVAIYTFFIFLCTQLKRYSWCCRFPLQFLVCFSKQSTKVSTAAMMMKRRCLQFVCCMLRLVTKVGSVCYCYSVFPCTVGGRGVGWGPASCILYFASSHPSLGCSHPLHFFFFNINAILLIVSCFPLFHLCRFSSAPSLFFFQFPSFPWPLPSDCTFATVNYREIPIINPGLIFFQKTFFFPGLILGKAYYWRKFCISKLIGLDNKNSLKH